MKVVAEHVIEATNGRIGIFKELSGGRYLYIHHKLRPWIITREHFESMQIEKILPTVSNLT